MKVLLLNGSPRKGNTFSALKIIEKGIEENLKADIEFIDIIKYKVNGCLACDCCLLNNEKCINHNDDGQFLIDKLDEADVVIFGTPVYWWGVSAQLKAVIDRMYMKRFREKRRYKQIGILAVGAATLDDEEYDLISRQFRCICDYLEWDLVIDKSISAYEKTDLLKNEEAVKELKKVWKNIKLK